MQKRSKYRRGAWIAGSCLTGMVLLFVVVGQGGCARLRPPRRPPDYTRQMSVTAYCSCGQCCGWTRDWLGRPVEKTSGRPKRVGQTASGTQATHGTVAAPRDIPFGTIVYVEGYGFGRVEDRGGAIRGDRLDLWFRSHRQALQWGRQKVRVQFWRPNDRNR
jgi:3D (Asp-Asp-Asp) domain-containing protein